MSDANLVRRVGFAALAIPLACVVIWVGGWLLVALVALIGVLGVRELLDFGERQGVRGWRLLAGLTAAACAPVAYLASTGGLPGWAPAAAPYVVALWLIVLLLWALGARRPDARPLGAVALTAFAVLYAGLLPAFIIPLRHGAGPVSRWQGLWLVLFPLVVTWICDTAAMFGGRAFGGPRLAPVVSPGKTRSGGIAGVVGGVVAAAVFALWVFPSAGIAAPVGGLIAIGGVLAVVGQFGDLVESLFKREVGLKDSSSLIPGHGGVLDRFDSLYFVLPVTAALYRACGLA